MTALLFFLKARKYKYTIFQSDTTMQYREMENNSHTIDDFYGEDSKACSEITYDPAVHRETWQNDNSFVLDVYTRRKRKCRGCELQFMQLASKFVIRHEERNHGSNQNVYYHCNPSCIKPLHPYFKACEVTATSTLARNLTVEDVKRIRRYDIELAFVHKV